MKIWDRVVHLLRCAAVPLLLPLPPLGSEILVFSPGATQLATAWPPKCAYINLAWFPEVHGLFLFFFWIYLFIFVRAGFELRAGASSSCGEQKLLSSCGARLSHCGAFSCCRAQALGTSASVVMAHVLSCPAACGIRVSGPGIKPMSPAWADEVLTAGALGKTLGLSFY